MSRRPAVVSARPTTVGIRTLILPRRNEHDLDDVPSDVRAELRFVFVDDADEVLRHALTTAAADVRVA